MGPTGFPETPVPSYHSTLRNMPENRNLIYVAAEASNRAFDSAITVNTLPLSIKTSRNISEKTRRFHLLETDGGSRLLQNITKYLQKQPASDTKQQQTALFTGTAFCARISYRKQHSSHESHDGTARHGSRYAASRILMFLNVQAVPRAHTEPCHELPGILQYRRGALSIPRPGKPLCVLIPLTPFHYIKAIVTACLKPRCT